MPYFWHYLAVVVLVLNGSRLEAAGFLADSIADFSATQGQQGWFYGFYNQGPVGGPHSYTTAAFAPFDTFNVARWEASDAQVGAQNNDFLNLNAEGGHPNGLGPAAQDRIIWAIRRYVSPIDGLLSIDFDLHKANIVEPRGGGITGRIFVDGVEVLTQFIANDDGVGLQGILTRAVSVGSVLDFAIDPTGILPAVGTDSIFSARADGTVFSARLSTQDVPEPAAWLLVGTGGLGVGLIRWRRRTTR